MRLLFATAALAALAAACSPDSDKTNPAIATDESVAERQSAAPAAGESSFTEGQARDRIVAAGYTDVTGLTKAGDGAWHGTAVMNGQSSAVTLDYQGNVTAAVAPAPAMPVPADMPPTPPATSTPPAQ